MKIAITGGAGFIGSHIARAYLDAGHDVLVIDSLINGSREAVDPRARFYRMDIRDNKLQIVLQKERPDIVSHHVVQREHCALPLEDLSLTDADVHVRGLINVLDSCVNASVSKLIFASGGHSLYGRLDPQQMRVKEDAPLCPLRPTDISKVAGEWYVRYYSRQYGLAHTILRYADVYGETHSELAQHPLTIFTSMLLEQCRPTMRGCADEILDHIWIDDVVRANLCALSRGKNQTLHISSNEGHSLKEIYQAAAQYLQSDIEPVYISNSLVQPFFCILDNTLAQHALAWHPTASFSMGVHLAVERLRKQRTAGNLVETPQAAPIPHLVGAS